MGLSLTLNDFVGADVVLGVAVVTKSDCIDGLIVCANRENAASRASTLTYFLLLEMMFNFPDPGSTWSLLECPK